MKGIFYLTGGFMKIFLKKYKEIIFFMLVYWIVCLLMFFKDTSFLYIMLSWNVLLAVLPLVFILKSETSLMQGRLGHSILWMIPWLLFFPNSVYMITDFIHISNDKFMWIVEVEKYSLDGGVVYSTDIMIWTKLLIIGVGFLFALLVGLESLYIFDKSIGIITLKPVSFLGVVLVSLLSGIGVYIGRFLRFNSWDMLFRPIQLFNQLVIGIDRFTIQFVATFSIFIIGCYILYRIFRRITCFYD